MLLSKGAGGDGRRGCSAGEGEGEPGRGGVPQKEGKGIGGRMGGSARRGGRGLFCRGKEEREKKGERVLLEKRKEKGEGLFCWR